MIKIVKTLSLTTLCLIAGFSLLTTGCRQDEAEQVYTQKALEDNAKLKQEIARLKQDMRNTDATGPEKLETSVSMLEQKLADIRTQEKDILAECVTLCEEWDKCNLKHSQLSAAIEELNAVFKSELDDARKQKNKISSYNEYLNQ